MLTFSFSILVILSICPVRRMKYRLLGYCWPRSIQSNASIILLSCSLLHHALRCDSQSDVSASGGLVQGASRILREHSRGAGC